MSKIEKINMKNLFAIIVITSFLISCSGTEVSELSFFNLKGKVAELSEKSLKATEKDDQIISSIELADRKINVKFNENGKLSEQIIFGNSGKPESKLVYKFKDGNVVSMDNFYEGEFDGRSDFQLKNGKVVSAKQYDQKGNYTGKSTLEYKSGLISSNHFFDKDDNLEFKIENEIKNGKTVGTKIFRVNDEIDNFVEHKSFEHNKEGNITKETIYKKDGEIEKAKDYEYTEFDEAENWINRVTRINGKVEEVTIREINYH